jgi:bifunctional enzyme CysN/CysC
MRGELRNFTGISSPYEAPENAEVHLKTLGADPDELALLIHELLTSRMEG